MIIYFFDIVIYELGEIRTKDSLLRAMVSCVEKLSSESLDQISSLLACITVICQGN